MIICLGRMGTPTRMWVTPGAAGANRSTWQIENIENKPATSLFAVQGSHWRHPLPSPGPHQAGPRREAAPTQAGKGAMGPGGPSGPVEPRRGPPPAPCRLLATVQAAPPDRP